MQAISSLVPRPAPAPASAGQVNEAPKVQRPEGEERSRSLKAQVDEYAPEEEPEPSGRYWLGRDEAGRPKICFDDPERDRGAEGPDQKAAGDKSESCTCNTDRVDREIERLRKKQAELEQRLRSETDAAQARELEKKLAQVESELGRKDNDAYRRRHAVFS